MTRKTFFTTMIALGLFLPTAAQTEKNYELQREMPVFLDQLKEELTYPLAWQNWNKTAKGNPEKAFAKWRKLAREKVFECMQAPPKRAAQWSAEILAEEQRDGYKARKIAFNLTAYSRATAYMLVPDAPKSLETGKNVSGKPKAKETGKTVSGAQKSSGTNKFPAVLLLHDHGGHYTIGKEKMIRPFGVSEEKLADADKWVAGGYDGQYFGDYLAKNGYVVMSIDALYWGDRGRKEGADGKQYAAVAGNFMMLGRSLSAFMNFEDVYSAEFLAEQPEVDAENIGCTGWSMGAYRAWMLSALTDKIKATVAVCWMNTTDSQFSWEYGRETGGFANMLPGLRRWLDYPHIASIACPKPTYFISGEKDKLFHPSGVREAFRMMREVWESRNAASNFKAELWNMPHHCGKDVQLAALDFLNSHLAK